jgi:phosphoserine aminotransferase
MSDRIFNFSAGPATMPLPVLETAQKELLNFNDSGMSVMEMSHRSKDFEAVLFACEQNIKDLYSVPDDYAVLFLQGGASLQFSQVPMNIAVDGKQANLLQTGSWTKKATKEIKKITELHVAATTESENFMRLPDQSEINMSSDPSFLYICSNNTIFGTQFKEMPKTGGVPLVADMSSEVFSRPLDISKFGIIFAGAQKNAGPAGVTIVIIKKSLAELVSDSVPTMLQYKSQIDNSSMYNTPPTLSIYFVKLVTDWLKDNGGLSAMEEINDRKAQLLYKEIDSNEYFYCPVELKSRSAMNVVFRIQGDKEELEKKFVSEANAAGLSGLKGHRSVGGLRASIYNAMPEEGIHALIDFMQKFAKENS